MNIYSWSIIRICLTVSFSILIWTVLGVSAKTKVKKRIWQTINAVFFSAAFYGILLYTVLYRTPTDVHKFTFFANIEDEFCREMVMNAFLYFPFGLTLSTLIGPVAILIAFTISVAIEVWQYLAGTGLAQGTDVIMNTLGCAIGVVPWMLVKIGFIRWNFASFSREGRI